MIARGSDVDELTVARQAVELARTGSSEGAAKGTSATTWSTAAQPRWNAFGYRPAGRERFLDWVLAHPGTVYFGAIAVLLGGCC